MNIKIDGASCNGCVQSIEKAIAQVGGVDTVSFSLESKLAVVTGSALREDVADAIEMAGFDVIDDEADSNA